jgi:glycosyltransferase involved in cell wall biosynthesis
LTSPLPALTLPVDVSCLTFTRGRPALLARAIACFDRQTYGDRALVIVVEEDDVAALRLLKTRAQDRTRICIVPPPGATLGKLRNIAGDVAGGDFVAQWDDDDFYHPERLEAQCHCLAATGKAACRLQRWLVTRGRRAAISGYRPWEGSIVCRKSALPRYPDLRRGEDTPVIAELSRRGDLCLLDRAVPLCLSVPWRQYLWQVPFQIHHALGHRTGDGGPIPDPQRRQPTNKRKMEIRCCGQVCHGIDTPEEG